MPTCSDFIQPLNLECIFINTLSGGMEMFVIVSILAIAALAGFFRMSNFTTIAMFGVYIIMMIPILGSVLSGLYVLLIVIIAFIVIKQISKVIKN